MKLIRIKATNFKGLSFDEPLAPLTIFVGSNFAGKTARTDAIRLLLLGWLPELGKAPRATFGLASGTEMIVEGTFDSGQLIRRRWFLKGDTVKSESIVPKEFEAAGGELAVMLDAGTYFGLSDRARIDYVFGLVNMGEKWTPAAILNRLEKFSKTPELQKLLVNRLEISATGQQFVDQAIEGAGDFWKQEKARAAGFEQMIQKLQTLRAADMLTGPTLAALEDRRAQIAREISTLNEQKGRFLGSFAQVKSDRARREQIDRDLRFGDKSRAELLAAQQKQALIEKDLAAATPAGSRAALSDALAAASGEVARSDIHLDGAQRTWNSLNAQLAEIDRATACPCCGAAGEGWKDAKRAKLTEELAEAARLLEAEKIKNASARAANREALAAMKDFDAAEDQRRRLANALVDVKADVARLMPMIARLADLAAERERLMPDDPALAQAVEDLQAKINVLEDEARGIDRGIRDAHARAGEIKRLAEAEKERDESRQAQEQASEIGKELRRLQGEMVEEAFTSLLDRANGFYQGVLKAPLSYNSAQGGEIGMWRDSQWVAHHTFSGTEKALTYAAIQAALSQKSPCSIMLIDELGRLDEENVMIMLEATKQALAGGLIDGFVGIDTGRLPLYRSARDSAFLVTQVG
jgi:hypothetical protein